MLVIHGYLAYLLYFLITGYHPAEPGYHPPFTVFVLDTVNLFIHEAGHFFLRPFWMWLYVLGGSLFQMLIPAALLIVSLRETPRYAGYPGFWLGENLVNVSAYVKDAPFMRLKLIAKGLVHDWNWLLNGDPDVAAFLGTSVFVAGLLICTASVVTAIFFAACTYREEGKVAAV